MRAASAEAEIAKSTLPEAVQQMPTMEAGMALLRGDLAKIGPVMGLYLARVLEIAGGIAITGNWSDKGWKNALAGSSAIQAFVLTYALMNGLDKSARLPSAQSAEAFVNGEKGSALKLGIHLVGRAGLIGAGIYLSGEREKVIPKALAGATAIELMVLLWAVQTKKKKDDQKEQ